MRPVLPPNASPRNGGKRRSRDHAEIVQGFLLGPDGDVAPLFRDDEKWAGLVTPRCPW